LYSIESIIFVIDFTRYILRHKDLNTKLNIWFYDCPMSICPKENFTFGFIGEGDVLNRFLFHAVCTDSASIVQ
jgi:hypothetical protein